MNEEHLSPLSDAEGQVSDAEIALRFMAKGRKKAVFAVGDAVIDDRGRLGVVVGRWGSLHMCLQCGAIVRDPIVVPNGRSKNGRKLELLLTPCCETRVFQAGCEDVLEVRRADGEIDAVNECWLKAAPVDTKNWQANAAVERLLNGKGKMADGTGKMADGKGPAAGLNYHGGARA